MNAHFPIFQEYTEVPISTERVTPKALFEKTVVSEELTQLFSVDIKLSPHGGSEVTLAGMESMVWASGNILLEIERSIFNLVSHKHLWKCFICGSEMEEKNTMKVSYDHSVPSFYLIDW
jgi:hypothetical protein